MRALRRFTVRAQLPAALAPLGDLVLNLRWSWHPETRDLFAAVDPEVWQAAEATRSSCSGTSVVSGSTNWQPTAGSCAD